MSNNNCKILTGAVAIIAIVGLMLYLKTEGYTTQNEILAADIINGYQTEDRKINEARSGLVGLIYPPRAGPLHTNREFPDKIESTKHPYYVLLDKPPFLKYMNQECPGYYTG